MANETTNPLIRASMLGNNNDNNNVNEPPLLNILTHPSITRLIKDIQEFNGNTKDLSTFVKEVEDILPFIRQYTPDSHLFIVNKIKAKLTGNAREVIKIYSGETERWEQIKQVLFQHFGGLDSEHRLYTKLIETKYKGNAYSYYTEIRSAISALIQKCELTNSYELIPTYRKKALETFTFGLPDSMRTIISAHNINSLDDAIRLLTEYRYIEDRHTNLPSHEFPRLQKPSQLPTNFAYRTPFIPRPNQAQYPKFQPNLSQPNQPPYQKFQPNSFPHHPNFNTSMPKPQYNPFVPKTNNQIQNTFKPRPDQPVPMDIDPRSSQIRRNYHNEQQEVDTSELDNYPPNEDPLSYDTDNYPCNIDNPDNLEYPSQEDNQYQENYGNFPLTASENEIHFHM